MPTNRTRKLRASKNRVPSNVTEEFMSDLETRDFLTQDGKSPYHDELNGEEKVLLGEFLKCGRDFKKWKKYREQKFKLTRKGPKGRQIR